MKDISSALQLASALRVPVFQRGTAVREKIDALEEYMLLSSYQAGELHEERLTRYREVAEVESEWAEMTGYEMLQRGKTDTAREEAKKQLRPELWDILREQRWHVARLTEEIDRLDRDANRVSRAYTIMTGV